MGAACRQDIGQQCCKHATVNPSWQIPHAFECKLLFRSHKQLKPCNNAAANQVGSILHKLAALHVAQACTYLVMLHAPLHPE